jgi:beta-1,4-mannosyltransferase
MTDAQSDATVVRVAHQPADHPYVRHISPATPTIVKDVDVWDVSAVVAAGVDIVHLHFGFETRRPDELAAWADDLRRCGVALVHTVHDLENPHLADQRCFGEQVATIVRHADALLTLTERTADVTAARFGRRPSVVGHPHVVALGDIARRRESPPVRGGAYIHAATVRPNLDIDLIECVADVAPQIGGVHIHVRDNAVHTCRARRLLALADRPAVTVRVEPRLTDDQLWDRLQHAAVVVLPYRWGTHSGLLEAAHDLGTPTAASLVGAYAEQGAHPLRTGRLADDLAAAARSTVDTDLASRVRQRCAIVDAHRRCYRALVVR